MGHAAPSSSSASADVRLLFIKKRDQFFSTAFKLMKSALFFDSVRYLCRRRKNWRRLLPACSVDNKSRGMQLRMRATRGHSTESSFYQDTASADRGLDAGPLFPGHFQRRCHRGVLTRGAPRVRGCCTFRTLRKCVAFHRSMATLKRGFPASLPPRVQTAGMVRTRRRASIAAARAFETFEASFVSFFVRVGSVCGCTGRDFDS